PHRRVRAVPAPARSGRLPGHRGARHLRVLPQHHRLPRRVLRHRRGPVQGRHRARPDPHRQQRRAPPRRARDLPEVMTTTATPTQRARQRKSNRPAWDEEPSFVGKFVKAAFMICYAAAIVIPIWAIVATSFASEEALQRAGGNLLLLPTQLSTQAYQEIFSGGALTDSLILTIVLTVIGTA